MGVIAWTENVATAEGKPSMFRNTNTMVIFDNMTDMVLEGDFYNTDSNGAAMELTFDGTEITGVISSGQFIHDNASFWLVDNPGFDESRAEGQDNLRYIAVDASGAAYETLFSNTLFGGIVYSPVYEDDNGEVTFFYDAAGTVYDEDAFVGYAIFYTDSQYYSQGTIVPGAAVNDPVSVTLKNGSVWNVTADSYVASIDVDDTSSVNGVITEIDGGYLVSPITAQAAPSGRDYSSTGIAAGFFRQRRTFAAPMSRNPHDAAASLIPKRYFS